MAPTRHATAAVPPRPCASPSGLLVLLLPLLLLLGHIARIQTPAVDASWVTPRDRGRRRRAAEASSAAPTEPSRRPPIQGWSDKHGLPSSKRVIRPRQAPLPKTGSTGKSSRGMLRGTALTSSTRPATVSAEASRYNSMPVDIPFDPWAAGGQTSSCSSSRDGFLDRCAAGDLEGNGQGATQRRGQRCRDDRAEVMGSVERYSERGYPVAATEKRLNARTGRRSGHTLVGKRGAARSGTEDRLVSASFRPGRLLEPRQAVLQAPGLGESCRGGVGDGDLIDPFEAAVGRGVSDPCPGGWRRRRPPTTLSPSAISSTISMWTSGKLARNGVSSVRPPEPTRAK